jgi:hypothetical protein
MADPTPTPAPELALGSQPDYGFGARADGTFKGLGYFGKIPRTDDPQAFSTELSSQVDLDGKALHFPLIVPTLTKEELDRLVSGKAPTKAIYDKAIAHALERVEAGKSPFAGHGEQGPLPAQQEEAAFQKGYQQP